MGEKEQPSFHQVVEQLTLLEQLDGVKTHKPDETLMEKIRNTTMYAYNMSLDMDVITGVLPTSPPDSFGGLKLQFLESAQRFQNLIELCDPYIDLAEEALTDSDGVNQLMEHGINSFFLVLRNYFLLFDVKQVPDILGEDEKSRFVQFLHRFMYNLDNFEPSDSVLNNLDRVALIMDTMVKEGQLNQLMGEERVREFIQQSPRTLAPLTRSHRAFMPISKVVKNQLLAAAEPLDVDVGGGALVHSAITIQDGVSLDEFDIEIQNTIGEMVQHNQDRALTATPAQIFRECAALMDKEKVGPDMETMVVASIDKMLLARATLDYSQQLQKHKRIKKQPNFDYDSYRLEGHLIEGRKLTVNAGGHTKIAYRFYDKPMYYAYSHAIGQIATVNKKLLNTSQSGDAQKSRKNTRDFVVLKRTLAREVERMKRESKKNGGLYEQRLSYARIQDEVGLSEASEKQLRTLRADIDYLCELWVNLGYIKAYEKYKSSKAFAGVKIDL